MKRRALTDRRIPILPCMSPQPNTEPWTDSDSRTLSLDRTRIDSRCWESPRKSVKSWKRTIPVYESDENRLDRAATYKDLRKFKISC